MPVSRGLSEGEWDAWRTNIDCPTPPTLPGFALARPSALEVSRNACHSGHASTTRAVRRPPSTVQDNKFSFSLPAHIVCLGEGRTRRRRARGFGKSCLWGKRASSPSGKCPPPPPGRVKSSGRAGGQEQGNIHPHLTYIAVNLGAEGRICP